jgi:hypothetical protein
VCIIYEIIRKGGFFTADGLAAELAKSKLITTKIDKLIKLKI